MKTIILLFLFIGALGYPTSGITNQDLGAVNVDFNLAILKDLYANDPKTTKDNVIFSAFSISQALSMLALGTRGNTFKQLLLYISPKADSGLTGTNQGALHSAISTLIQNLARSPNVTLNIANGGYPSVKFNLNPDFVSQASKYYAAVWKSLDFSKEPSQSANVINTDVERATNGKIKDLIPSSTLGSHTALVLTNAVYFKGSWKIPFDPEKSTQRPFYTDDGAIQQVQMMEDTRRVLYGSLIISGLKVEAIELEYGNDNIVMLYVLPPKNSLKRLTSLLTRADLENLKGCLKHKLTDIVLPVFNATTSVTLKSSLSRLGVPDIFGSSADLSGITPIGSVARLSVDDIYHKAFIMVNEEGTEAAAATGIVVSLTALIVNTEFKADRPFLYFILDKISGTILFTGSYIQVP